MKVEQMRFPFMRCFECCSNDLEEEYDGAPLTCKGCGVIGNVEKIPNADDLADALTMCHVDKEFPFMLNFAKELEAQNDISDLMVSLKITRKKRSAPRYKPY